MADGVRFERRMSDTDALMWSVEGDPVLRSAIVLVNLLDRAPDLGHLRDRVARTCVTVPRLAEVPAVTPFDIAPPTWEPDEHFDLDHHLRVEQAPAGAGVDHVLGVAAGMAASDFEPGRPLWEFRVVHGLADGRATLIQKIHHSITDGVGGIELALSLYQVDRDTTMPAEPVPERPAGPPAGPADRLVDGMLHERRRLGGIVDRSLARLPEALADPGAVAASLASTGASALRLLAPAFEPLSPVLQGRSLPCEFRQLEVPMAPLKQAAALVGGRLNDAFLAAVASGMDAYHRRHGHDVAILRVGMPINTRSSETADVAGNQFVPARFLLPLDVADPLERIATMRALVAAQRAEPSLALAEPVAGVLYRLPRLAVARLFGALLKSVDLVVSNVPGVPFPVFLSGAAVEATVPFGPRGGAAVNVTLLSYCDVLHIGVNADPAAVSDPDVLVDCLADAFAELLALVPTPQPTA